MDPNDHPAPILARLENARNEVAQLERQIAQASCREVGHTWVFLGGSHCGCDNEHHGCSVSVHECAKCGDCDYGESEMADADRARCVCKDEDADQ